jgi:drug/metabolite transporter (DMT)-like permease
VVSAVEAPAGPQRLDGLATTIVVACSFIWGFNQIAIKVANGGLHPVFQAGLRSLFALFLLLGWCRLRRIPLAFSDGTLMPGLLAGVVFGLQFVLINTGLDYTSVSRGIVFFYTMPIWVAIGAHFWLGERLTPMKVAGLLAAFGGVVVVFLDRLSLPSPTALIGDGLCLAAALLWASSTLIVKGTRLRFASPEKALIYQLAVSAVMILPISPFVGPLVRHFDGVVAAALAYQVVIVVAFSYLVWIWLLKRYPASRLSSFAFLTPLSALVMAGVLLHEPMSQWLVVALVLVGIGIVLVNRREAV